MRQHAFDGLKFRIMETLEQAKGVPLTSVEITDRLMATVYKDQLRENVVFRVSQKVHSMKNKGEIVQADARGAGGQLTYTLPHRLTFPPEEAKPVVNPVLPPEIAAEILTAPSKPAPKPPRRQPVLVPGIGDKIVEFVDHAAEPVTVSQIVDALGHLYGDHYKVRKDMVTTFSGHVHNLHKRRKLLRNNVTGRGVGVQYEYFTRKTGKRKAPLIDKIAEAPKPAPASPPPAPAGKPVFRPQAERTVGVTVQMPASKYLLVEKKAAEFNVPVEVFCEQAIEFALSYTEGE